MGVQLIGMSIDQIFSHIKWVGWIQAKLGVEITFPVVAANDSVASKLGMLHPGKGINTVCAVFIVDLESKVRLVVYYPQEIGRNMDEIVRATKVLIASDTEGVTVSVSFLAGCGDATQEMTDRASFEVLEPVYDGYRNRLKKKYLVSPEEKFLDRTWLIGLTASEMMALVGGMRVLGANYGSTAHDVFSNDFFVNLTDMGSTWVSSSKILLNS